MQEQNKSVPPRRLAVNASYVFVILLGSFLISQFVGMICGWIFTPKEIIGSHGDLSYNYYVAYPVRGVIMLAVFLLCLCAFSRTHGFRVGFSLREEVTKSDFWIETIPALLLFGFLAYWIFFDVTAAWYIAGGLAALFGLVNAPDLFSMTFRGNPLEARVTVEEIALYYYWWLPLLLDAIIAVGAVFLLYRFRRKGELAAREAHEKQLAEMQSEQRR